MKVLPLLLAAMLVLLMPVVEGCGVSGIKIGLNGIDIELDEKTESGPDTTTTSSPPAPEGPATCDTRIADLETTAKNETDARVRSLLYDVIDAQKAHCAQPDSVNKALLNAAWEAYDSYRAPTS